MSECVIVAVPRADDYTHKISSEKIPHMTLLYLGEVNDGPTMSRIASFVEHAASELDRFGLDVDRRGILGDDDADVLFFKASYTNKIEEFRKNLLMNNDIRAAYETAMQHPQWTPHLTLGYPDSPAKEIDRDYGINWVEFDRIAVWFGDFEGPEFQLEDNTMSYVDEVAYSMDDEVEDFLAHYGVKGMKWGVRKDRGNEGERASKRTIDKADREYDKEYAGFSGYVKINNLIADTFNSNVGVLNDKYADIDIDVAPPSVKKEYYREVEQLFDRSIAVANQRLGTNASGTKRVRANRVGEGINTGFEVIYEELKHSEEPTRFRYLPKFNDKGFVVGFSIAPEEDMAEHTDLSNFLAHYGVKGMKWGVRRDRPEGVSARTSREAKKDATEFSKAKMFYGKGAGTRRKLIKATVETKASKDPSYKKAFDHHLGNQDMAKRASQARGERKRTDRKESVKKTTRGVYRLSTGGWGATTAAAGAIYGGYSLARKTGVDQTIIRSGTRAVKQAVNSPLAKTGADFIKKTFGS